MTESPFLNFAKPWLNQAAIDEVVACLQSGWLATGPRVQKFEEMLRSYFHAPHALTVSSGTGGLHITWLALELKPADEVIVPAMTFVATFNTIIAAGGKPVLVDVDSTYNIDVSKIEAAITPRTRAIAPVYFTGLAPDMDAIYAIAKKYHLRVFEDAAQAIGSEYKKQRVGSFGDTQLFSFHPNKVITTGEGGCVTTRDDVLTKKISLWRFQGIDRDVWNRFSKHGSQTYDVVLPGLKYNMTDIQAAIGIHQLPMLDEIIQRRTDWVDRYYTLLKDWPELTLPQLPAYAHRHNWHLFCPLINPEAAGMTRHEFMQRMKEENIGTGLHYEAPHLYTYFRENLGYKTGDFPVAETIGERIVSLPLFPQMTEAEHERVICAMRKIFKRKM